MLLPEKPISHEQSTRIYNMEASAYCTGTITRSGLRVRYGLVASDPRMIALGSEIYIQGMGTFLVADTGGAIKGNKLDIYMPSYSKCISFGVRKVKVIVLKKGE